MANMDSGSHDKEVATVRVAAGGRIVVPAKMREKLGMKVGNYVTFRMKDNSLEVTTPEMALRRLRALVREHVPENVSLVDELIKERREEALNE